MKYAEIKTSKGYKEGTYSENFASNPFEKLEIHFAISGDYKLYLNDGADYILFDAANTPCKYIVEDFQINSFKVEAEIPSSYQYILYR